MEKTKRFYMHRIANLLNIQKIVTIHYQELSRNYASREESHDFWEIIYADKENLSIVLDEERVPLSQGEMIFIKPNQKHFVESGKKEPNIFIVSFECRSESMGFFCDKKFPVPENYRYLLQNIMSEATETFVIPDFDPDLKKLELRENPNLGGEQVIKNSLELLLVYLLRSASGQNSPQEFFISKISSSSDLQDEIVRILSSRLYDRFELDDLCSQLHYGKTYLCTFFREKTGMSIYRTYLRLKTDESKKLIRLKYSFSEIAEKLCFDSLSHFNYVFKKYVGMTPGEYKESIK
ncbi:MAG TPA: helix-turn-helix transcriptional regulator [Candidatus Scatosoma pullistercoris]|uniref:Helix-turn-helix transcriptional regulator n=1 Tax=Candidatus Scatosoma pullistercoris TaxID=2840934 RepID=A0A9D1SFG6_9FIRM|nr:helix-turn-helix transcriptional regulator [Candidatus Scatosoma pullistercoris]